MPYTLDSKKLPANVMNMPAPLRKKWIETFNAAHARCLRSGGKECESLAFRVANGTAKESAAVEQELAVRESCSISDFTPVEIEEGSLVENGKRELIVTLLREGPGNRFHNNYYRREALDSVLKEVKSRPKQYFNHARDVDNPDRDLRDWASSVQEAWIDTSGPQARLKARVKVYDDWLWQRAKDAPAEMAVSIEGKGRGKQETIEGQAFNAIYEINRVNGVNWVDYPGNAGMGVQILEKDKGVTDAKEDTKMDIKEILEGLKGLSEQELKEVAEARPEIKEFFVIPQGDEGTSSKLAELQEKMKSYDNQSRTMAEKLSVMEQEKLELQNKVEAHEIRAKAIEKEKMVDKMLTDSKLKAEHITETFREQLKQADEAGIKKLIEDREKICIVEVANPGPAGAPAPAGLSEKQMAQKFVQNIFGEDVSDILELEKV